MSESEFHYVRTYGVDGGVDAVDGRAIGVDLESILKDGLPPFKVALEVIASLCEILDIADQDGEIHGDVHPSNIFIDDTGAVSLEGYGIERGETYAPEGEPIGTGTDLYGLGYCAYRLLAPRDLKDLPDDPDGHDDAVIDAVVALPWGDMPEEWVGDIQWFLAKLMSFEEEERPSAVDAWRTFIAFAEEAEGASIVDWAPDAIEGGGERRDAAMAVRPAADEGEDLGGPVVKSGPLSKGAISFGGGGAKSGQATAFWSKDQMKAALEAEPEEEEETFKPAVGGGAATSFWTRDQMEAMARGDAEAPRPKRKEGGKKPPRKPAAEAAPPPAVPPPVSPPPKAAAPSPPPAASPPPKASPPPASPPPVAAQGAPVAAAGPAIAQPGGGGAAPPPVDDDQNEGGGMKMAAIAGVVIVLLLLCLGIGGVGIGAMVFMGGDDSSSASSTSDDTRADADEDAADDEEEEVEEQDTAVEVVGEDNSEPAAEEPPKEEPPPKPTQSSSGNRGTTSGTTSGSNRTRSSGRRSTTRSSGNRSAPAAGGPARVVFTVPGAGDIRCGDGTNKDVDGKASLMFRSVPADGITCTFYEGGSKPVCAGFVEPGKRKCNCDAGSAEITCE